MEKYIISIDQSTQGTKAMIFGQSGRLIKRCDKAHKQIINDAGWVSHDPEEIYQNTIEVISKLVEESGVDRKQLACLSISNQRETTVAWDRVTGESVCPAVVWQCARAAEICQRAEIAEKAEAIRAKTGMQLSPYFPAAKMAWMLEHNEKAKTLKKQGNLCMGTIDSYLVFRLTGGKEHRTDYSNACRTQLFNIHDLKWDEELLEWFRVPIETLGTVTDSDACFGYTDLEGYLDTWIPICGVLGDSHGALFGQGCLKPGMTKTTYGTGSSIMMNIGDKAVLSEHGLVTSLAWKRNGKVEYVLEGNLNYTGAVITWLKDDLMLIRSPGETEQLALEANKNDQVYLVPAFSGLGAPYWKTAAKAAIIGMDRTTGRNEIVRAGVESIAYQVTDILKAMEQDMGKPFAELCVDGGPTKNKYLMQFQSDMSQVTVRVAESEELSGIGVAYLAGIAMGIWDETIFELIGRKDYIPKMDTARAEEKYAGWKDAVSASIGK